MTNARHHWRRSAAEIKSGGIGNAFGSYGKHGNPQQHGGDEIGSAVQSASGGRGVTSAPPPLLGQRFPCSTRRNTQISTGTGLKKSGMSRTM